MKNIISPFWGRALTRAAFILPLSIAALLPTGTEAAGQPFSKIVVFGDSLSDTGAFHQQTGFPPPPYHEGRFSNGPVWHEYMADALGMAVLLENNYAFAGATTGRANLNDVPGVAEFPGLQDEIDQYSADSPGQRADERALHIVWAGANDFFLMSAVGGSPEQTIANGVANTALAVQRLYAMGAKHIMVVNLPDLGLTPTARATGMGPALTFLSQVYNGALEGALDQLAAVGADTIRLDSAGFMNALASDPSGFGFTNVDDAFLAVGGDPDEFMFWDGVHPTTRTHAMLAVDGLEALWGFYAPDARRSFDGEIRRGWVESRGRASARGVERR